MFFIEIPSLVSGTQSLQLSSKIMIVLFYFLLPHLPASHFHHHKFCLIPELKKLILHKDLCSVNNTIQLITMGFCIVV